MTEVAIETANKEYKYDQKFSLTGSLLMSDIVNKCHRCFSAKNKWDYKPLFPGTFGYDNMVNSLGHTLKATEEKTGTSKMWPQLIHEGWVRNYLHWRDQKPFESSQLYKRPFAPLGDARRNLCAEQTFNELPSEEQTKDIALAECLQTVVDEVQKEQH